MKAQSFLSAFNEAAREDPRIFFAPLIGAVRAIRRELRHARRGGSGDQQRRPEKKDTQTAA